MRIIMHIDVNSAYLSWSAIDLLNNGYNYDIRNSYAVIGGSKIEGKGIIVAASIPAKKIGIKTAETIYSAKRKCPNLKIFPANFEFYNKMSDSLFELLKKYTPDIEVASIDECYLDFTPIAWKYKSPYEFASLIQKEVNEKLGFTINVGIANNMICAKMASDFEKPNKIHTLYEDEFKTKMWHFPVSRLHGVGKKSTIKLEQLGINTIKDLANQNELLLYKYFKNQARYLIDIANGIDKREVNSNNEENISIGNEITLPTNIDELSNLYKYLLELSEKVGRRVRSVNKYAYVIVVTYKNSSFVRKSHQRKLINPTNNSELIYKEAISLLNEFWNKENIRLIGIRLDKLVDNVYFQNSIFDNASSVIKTDGLDKIVDKINDKYGKSIIKKATTYRKEE